MTKHHIDEYAIIGAFLALIPILAWIKTLNMQFDYLKTSTLRVQVLSTRTALFLPTYAVLMWIGLVFPDIYILIEAPIAIAEGLSFYGFLAMTVTNLGGPDMMLQKMDQMEFSPKCGCPKNPRVFYTRVLNALHYFLYYRSVITIIAAICSFAGFMVGFMVCTVITVVMFLWCFAHLVFFYENVMHLSSNINATYKILLIKISVGVIVIQGLIIDILLTTGTLKIHGNQDYDEDQRFAILIEYTIFSLLLYLAFALEIAPQEDSELLTGGAEQDHSRPDLTYSAFSKQVFAISDVFDNLQPAPEGSDLKQKFLDPI